MQFHLIDRVVELDPGRRIVAEKSVSLAEEYLAEHFPDFPVLPGVLMLETMVQAARWLVHQVQDFTVPLILLESVKGVTYKAFVAPGDVLRVDVRCKSLASDRSEFQGAGFCNGREAVKGRFALTHARLTGDATSTGPSGAHEAVESSRHADAKGRDLDGDQILSSARRRWNQICRIASSEASSATG